VKFSARHRLAYSPAATELANSVVSTSLDTKVAVKHTLYVVDMPFFDLSASLKVITEDRCAYAAFPP
jgi:hypothetical protein